MQKNKPHTYFLHIVGLNLFCRQCCCHIIDASNRPPTPLLRFGHGRHVYPLFCHQDRPGLFQGITFHFRGQFGTTGSPPLSDLESMLLANAGKVVSTLGSLYGARSIPLGSGSGGGGGSGGWRPRKVVIFQPSSSDEDQRALEEKKLAAALAAEAELSRQGSESAPRGGGGCGRDDDRVVVVIDVVRPIWLVDSVGCFRVLKPAVHHRVPGFGLE